MQLYQFSFPNGKKYIGITAFGVEHRLKGHLLAAKHKPTLVHKAINKYGLDSIEIKVLAECDNWELLCLAEQEAIEKFNTLVSNGKGYNLTLGGEGNLRFIDGYIKARKNEHKIYRAAYYLKHKDILRANHKKYQETNKEKLQVKSKEWREANKEYIYQSKKEYREKNKEAIAAHKKEYAQANKEAIAAKGKVYRESLSDDEKQRLADNAKKRYLANKEAVEARRKAWRIANKEAIAERNKQRILNKQ